MRNLILVFIFCLSCGDKAILEPEQWTREHPEDVGLNNQILTELTSQLDDGKLGLVSSLLIIRNNKLVYEHYLLGMSPDKLHVNYSVTKSITSCLIGMALEKGSIKNLNDPVMNYFSEYQNLLNDHTWKKEITLEHLLQMKAGYDWDESTHNYGTPMNSTTNLINSTDWIKFVLDQPLSKQPGTDYTYNSGCTVLLSGIIENTYGASAESFAIEHLFKPLGINTYQWQEGSNGLTNTGFGLSLSPYDMAKFGQLYLNGGIWNGEQLISQDWIDKSFEPHSDFGNGTGYGYQWRLFTIEIDSEEHIIPYANGHGNQYIFVVKPFDMVIVITSENFNRAPSHINEIIFDFIFESVN